MAGSMELGNRKKRLEGAGQEFLQYLRTNRNGCTDEDIEQIGLILKSAMTMITSVLIAAAPSATSQNRIASSTERDSVTNITFNSTASVISPPEDAQVVAGEIQESDVAIVFQSFNRSREARLAILSNMASVTMTNSDYLELETNVRDKISRWRTYATSFTTTITETHKTAIADYVCSNWIRRRRCVSVEIFRQRQIWEPLVKAVFANESLEEQNRLIEFFQRSVTGRNNLKAIWMLIIGVHDNNCGCHPVPRPT